MTTGLITVHNDLNKDLYSEMYGAGTFLIEQSVHSLYIQYVCIRVLELFCFLIYIYTQKCLKHHNNFGLR